MVDDFWHTWAVTIMPALEALPPQTEYWTRELSRDALLGKLAALMADEASTILHDKYVSGLGLVVARVELVVEELLPA